MKYTRISILLALSVLLCLSCERIEPISHDFSFYTPSGDPPNELDGNINIRWGTDGHTGVPVPVFAYGPHAEKFMGWYDNTEIPKKIAKILGIPNFPRKIIN